ncbi:hypothetical protein [Aristophania vespae]|uniref:hypothetical protein n=1 Tax=Aristophania vespae TaxID=2697033 RepID=UPI0023519362|nr:hypothetical protein [Aristophania vespae]UMM63960.1 hypothetical protein DM15PD_09400 [Aristophania vespae]
MKGRLMSLFFGSLKRCQAKRRHNLWAALLLLGSSQAALADTPVHTILPGEELDLSVPCAMVLLSVTPKLKNSVTIDEVNGASPEVVRGKDGTENRVALALRGCNKGSSLHMHLSPNTTLTLHDSHDARIIIEGSLASLETSLNDASLTAETVQSLDLSASGDTQIAIQNLNRAAQIVASDRSQLHIGRVALTALSAKLSGASNLQVGSGQIDTATLTLTDQATSHISALIGKAVVTAQNTSKVALGPIRGALFPTGTGTIEQLHTLESAPVTTQQQTGPQPPAQTEPKTQSQTPTPETPASNNNSAPINIPASQPVDAQPVTPQPASTAQQPTPAPSSDKDSETSVPAPSISIIPTEKKKSEDESVAPSSDTEQTQEEQSTTSEAASETTADTTSVMPATEDNKTDSLKPLP